jgi:hypothetical protein
VVVSEHECWQLSGIMSRKRKVAKIVLICLAVLLPVLVGQKLYFRAQANRLIAEIRAAGEPTTLAELDAWYVTPPDDQNAALILTNVVAQLASSLAYENRSEAEKKLPFIGGGFAPVLGERLPPETLTTLESLLARHAKVLAQLEEALTRPAMRFPGPIRDAEGRFKWPEQAFSLDRPLDLLRAKATVEAERGDSTAALNTLTQAYQLANTLNEIPLVICQIMQRAWYRRTSKTLEWVLSQSSVSPTDLQRLQELLTEYAAACDMSRALAGDRAEVLHFHQHDRKEIHRRVAGATHEEYAQAAWVIEPLMWPFRGLGFSDRDLIFYLKMMKRAQQAAAGTLAEQWQFHQEFTEWLENDNGNWGFILSNYHLPYLKKPTLRNILAVLELHAARYALAVERFRHENEGRMPDRLENLVPEFFDEIITDPRNDEPLRRLQHLHRGRSPVHGEHSTDQAMTRARAAKVVPTNWLPGGGVPSVWSASLAMPNRSRWVDFMLVNHAAGDPADTPALLPKSSDPHRDDRPVDSSPALRPFWRRFERSPSHPHRRTEGPLDCGRRSPAPQLVRPASTLCPADDPRTGQRGRRDRHQRNLRRRGTRESPAGRARTVDRP